MEKDTSHRENFLKGTSSDANIWFYDPSFKYFILAILQEVSWPGGIGHVGVLGCPALNDD